MTAVFRDPRKFVVQPRLKIGQATINWCPCAWAIAITVSFNTSRLSISRGSERKREREKSFSSAKVAAVWWLNRRKCLIISCSIFCSSEY